MATDLSPVFVLLLAMLVNNIVLSRFLGLCSFVACSAEMATAAGLGAAVCFVTTLTVPLNYALDVGVLRPGAPLCPPDLTHLRYLVFIVVIAGFVQLVEMVTERFAPRLHGALGIFLPLITVNCALFGAILFALADGLTFAQSCGFGLGAGLGWWLAILLMAGLRQKMRYADIPEPFRGSAVVMIVTGVMAMAFMAFAGAAG